MSQPRYRYPLDPTGTNPDNLITDEIHDLPNREVRVVVPNYGPFYKESIKVFDYQTSRPLSYPSEYRIVELLQDASLKFGKEIAQVILITDTTVSGQIVIEYQSLGGLYQNNMDAVIHMYETILKDNRPIDWVDILNKPTTYPPSLHQHLLSDIYGFEPVIVALERVRNAIILSDVPVIEMILDNIATEEEIDRVALIKKFISLERLVYSTKELNFNAITITPTLGVVSEGGMLEFSLSTTNLEDDTVLFWNIKHYETNTSDFVSDNGAFSVIGNRASFSFGISTTRFAEPNERFKVQIRKNSISGPLLAETSFFTIRANSPVRDDASWMLNNCCWYHNKVKRNAKALFYQKSKS